MNRVNTIATRAALRLSGRRRVGLITGGGSNLGDYSISEALKLAFPLSITVTSAGAERKLARIGLSGRELFRGIVLGGGTLINDYAFSTVRSALELGIPVASIGTGVGQGGFDQPAGIDLTKWIELLRQFSVISVRGFRSRDSLERLGVSGVQVCGDTALLHAREQALDVSSNRPTLAVNLLRPHSHAGFGMEQILPLVESVGRAAEQGWDIICVGNSVSDVSLLAELFHGRLPSQVKPILPANTEECLNILCHCHAMISMRLHGAVLASCVGVPAIVIRYMDKCVDFAETMNITDGLIPIERIDSHRITGLLQEYLKRGFSYRQRILQNARDWQGRLRSVVRQVNTAWT